MRIACLIALALSACTSVHVNRATLIASTAAIACDWGQTYKAADDDWTRTVDGKRMPLMEQNPVLGRTPDPGAVNVYFLSAIMINATAWLLTPARYRSVISGTVAALQTGSVVGNMQWGTGMCGM